MRRADNAATAKRAVRRGLAKAGLTLDRFPHRLGPGHHLINLIRFYDVDCVLDVGANEGQFGTMLRESGYGGPIISFEPLPETYQKLQDTVSRDQSWTARQLALGDQAGMTHLNVTAESTVASILRPTEWWSDQWSGAQVHRAVEIRVAALDDLAAEIPYGRLFLKIDTQGYDLRVLAGADSILKRVVGVQTEMSAVPLYEGMPNYVETLQAMHALGFALSGIFPVLSDERFRAIELDGVFVRA